MLNRTLLFLLAVLRPVRAALLPPSCRFEPTCSRYAVDALRAHPASKAVPMIVRRLLKCRPLHPGGYDPVQREA